MPRQLTTRRREKPASKTKRSRVVIAVAALAVAASVALFIFASMRSDSESQSTGTALKKPSVASDERARQVSYEVVNSYAHDSTSFTQGLLWHDGGFYESTGQYGQSKLRRLELPSGKVLKEISLTPELFGEGLALVDGRLIQ